MTPSEYASVRDAANALVRQPTIDDDEREEMIVWAGLRMANAKTPAARREAWVDLKLLITGRSAAQVDKMEREKGLR